MAFQVEWPWVTTVQMDPTKNLLKGRMRKDAVTVESVETGRENVNKETPVVTNSQLFHPASRWKLQFGSTIIVMPDNCHTESVTCEIFKRFTGASTCHCLVAPVKFSIRFFQKRAPKLVFAATANEHESSTSSREAIIYDHIDPPPLLPESEVKSTCRQE